ncbi:flavin reductase family protein [Rubellimicrobium roseum]|uniref:Flavin reductase family protein n=1 Tax=Rubellimicrobium roseum TaxID=687525 RepID=A0A5C4NJQ8_9RHOB|nr:flavin reductase family protein [Rubellimicrobium roseum]TNC73326.1 flavin reductase family protein [Rubellimicrobium roseum]
MTDGPDKAAFRAALAAFAGPCSVVAAGRPGERTGLIVTSCVSPSADPPLLLAAISARASTLAAIEREGCFGWSVLGEAHEAVARRLAGFGGIKGEARFEGADWAALETGAPLLADAPATFDCTLEDLIPREGYTVVLGRVRALRIGHGGALLWHRGGWRPLPAP